MDTATTARRRRSTATRISRWPALPPLPDGGAERQEALSELAGLVVGSYGATTARHLAAELDESADDMEGRSHAP
jgi:hypothetical protein